MDSELGIRINNEKLCNNNLPPQQHEHQHQPPKVAATITTAITTTTATTTTPATATTSRQINADDLEAFFEKAQFNSCQSTDELIKSIEEAQDEALTKKALDLYQNHYSTLDKPWEHVSFMYGLGLIYMHFNAYNFAVKSFREAIYVHPSFPRSRDVHTRLGLIFKATRRFRLSEKHFNLAINDTRQDSGSSTKQELRFHLAHIYELQGKLEQATEAYERLLQEDDLPLKLSANIRRHLGCICYSSSLNSSKDIFNQYGANSKRDNGLYQRPNNSNNNTTTTMSMDASKMNAALNYLNTSYRNDSDSRTSYYLGRCLTNIGKFQDAFASYRSVIDRDESTSDTWCSIGVLYHRQNQPWDALQAYIRSVQFDKKHAVAWMNLGILYESQNQYRDALKCYQHVLRSNSKEIDKSLPARIRYIQKHLSEIDASSGNNGVPKSNSSDKLLSLEDLWNLESNTNPASSSNSTVNSRSSSSSLSSSGTAKVIKTNGPIIVRTNCTSNNILKSSPEVDSKPMLKADTIVTKLPAYNHNGLPDCKLEDTKDFTLNQALTNGTSKDSGISSNSSTYADCALVPSQGSDICSASYISAEQLVEACRNSPKPRKIHINLLSDDDKPPNTFPRNPPYPPISSDKLFPSPPIIFLESKKETMSKKLQEFCQSSPISIVRNMATVLKLDLGLFSTRALVENDPDQKIKIVSHNYLKEGPDDDMKNQWSCERQISTSTISRYANYQAASFRESLLEERGAKTRTTNLVKEYETDSNESGTTKKNNGQGTSNFSSCSYNPHPKTGPASKKLKKELPEIKLVRAAVEIDLSDDKKWRPQLTELNKLPSFIKCVSASNMLTHLGTSYPGLNTIAMSMHVPGCRSVDHGSLNNLCQIHINTGPGDFEWNAVPSEYERTLMKLCNKNGHELDGKDWWPKLSDLQRNNIPIYRFSQKPGDMVWVNSGTLYWVQATGWTNSIYWNVGQLCARQFRLSAESFEIGKMLFRKSEVPIVQLTWNIVINVNIIVEDELFRHVSDVMRRSLKYCIYIKDIIKELRKDVQPADIEPGPRCAQFCALCDDEAFNITFSRKQDGALHCIECARRFSPSLDNYYIRQEYRLNYLTRLYDNFIETKRRFQIRQQQQQQQPEKSV